MTAADHEEYMQTVHQYLIDDYHGSEVMKNLLSIVRNKPYFIVTSNGDAHFQMNGFDRDRIFEVEGNFEGLTEGSEEWNGQRQRFYAFLQEYSGQNALLFELGIGSRNQLIKAPTMGMAAEYPEHEVTDYEIKWTIRKNQGESFGAIGIFFFCPGGPAGYSDTIYR